MLQDADKKGLGTIAEEVKQLAHKARDNSLKPADYEVRCKKWLLSKRKNKILDTFGAYF